MFTGKTKNLGVMGYPIAHSLSPAIQQAAIGAAGLDYAYIALPVAREKLAAAVAGLRAMEFSGFNVTIPHKSAIMPLLDEIDEDARVIGAVNTVVNREGRLVGFNTDVLGFLLPLKEKNVAMRGAHAVILGAGGAARAVLWGLLRSGVASVTLAVRTPAKAEALIADFRERTEASLAAVSFEAAEYGEALKKASLIVNTTPLGMTPKVDAMPPVPWECVQAGTFVYDVIYTPAETRLLKEAKAHGCETQNGERMLAGQGAAALHLWTGIEPDIEVMCRALRAELEKK